MKFAAFENTAREVWDEIPAQYKQGVDGLIVDQDALPRAEDPDVFTLGECATEEYPSQYGGPDTIRSAVVLYYGSFCEVARDDAEFDWPGEIRETIMHELQHHLESLATDDALEDMDYAVDENYKRVRGDAFDPLFYRAGEAVSAVSAVDAYSVDGDVFIEIATRRGELMHFEFEWEYSKYSVELPQTDADVAYHYVEAGPDIGDRDFCIVRVLKRGALAALRSALRTGYSVDEAMITARRVS